MATEKSRLLETVVDFKSIDSLDKYSEMDDTWLGMSLEELIPYINDSYWFYLRIVILVFYWTIFICFLSMALLIIVKTPRCHQDLVNFNLTFSRNVSSHLYAL